MLRKAYLPSPAVLLNGDKPQDSSLEMTIWVVQLAPTLAGLSAAVQSDKTYSHISSPTLRHATSATTVMQHVRDGKWLAPGCRYSATISSKGLSAGLTEVS